MSDHALSVEWIALRRGAVFEPPGLQLEGLSAGINVIYGPNASGKTTLARAVRTLLWPENPLFDTARIEGGICEGTRNWRVEFMDGRVTVQCDGPEVSQGLPVPPVKTSDRYYLCLQELLQGTDHRFAAQILRESVGGYDVGAAREAVNHRMPSLRPTNATRAAKKARQDWQKARQKQQDLRSESRSLESLRERQTQAEKAQARAEAIEAAIEWRKAEQEREDRELELEKFPEAIANVRGDEVEALRAHRETLEEERKQWRQAKAAVATCESELESSAIPDGGLPDDVVAIIEQYKKQLQSAEADQNRLQAELAKARSARDKIGRYLTGVDRDTPLETLEAVDADDIRRIEDVALQLETLRGDGRAYEVLRSLLESPDVQNEAEPELLKQGISILRRWLRSPGPEDDTQSREKPSQRSGIGLISALVVGVVGIALSVVIHLLWVLLAGVALIQFWLFWKGRQRSDDMNAQDTRRDVYRSEFEGLDLESPSQWDEDAVRQCLDDLNRRHARRLIDDEKSRRWQAFADEHRQTVEEARDLDLRRERIAKRLGLDIDEGPAGIFWIVNKIEQWQRADRAVTELEKQWEKVSQRWNDALDGLNQRLTQYDYKRAGDLAQAVGRVEAFGDEVRRINACSERLSRNQRAAASADERRQRAAREVDAIFERVGLEAGDDQGLVDLCDKRPDYDDLRKKYEEARVRARSRLTDLKQNPGFCEDLLDWEFETLRRELDLQQEIAQTRDETLQKIEQITTRIEDAKQSVDLEEKRADYDRARRSLARERDGDYRKVVGTILADYVEEQTRHRSRPQVFHRARELFAQITRGQYELELVDAEQGPAFRALDVNRRVGLTLDQLSGGTRVQLLLAVRIAFVERHERGGRVPLILDEALATSDDIRVVEIIDAVRQIAAQGRQVLYFTAQRDEVRKWQDSLADDDVALSTHRLNTGDHTLPVRELRKFEPLDLIGGRIPKPQGREHTDYGELLEVSGGVDPWIPVTDVHLWYLVENLEILYRLLSSGIERWGSLRLLARDNGLAAVGLGAGELRRIAARARALESLLKARQIGHGLPVQRSVLEASGAVSDTFIEEVSHLCKDLDGDGLELVRALQTGEVKRFRSDKVEQLRTFFRQEGYLDERDTLDSSQIWVRALAAVADDIGAGHLDERDLRRLLERATGQSWTEVCADAT